MSAAIDTAALNLAWAAALLDELVRAGLRQACLSPGSRSSPLALALAARAELGVSVHIDERSAAFFALGYGRATGRPALFVCTSGTAGANAYPAVIEARMGGVPLLVATADRPPELRDTGASQTIDQHGLFGAYPRWSADLPPPAPGAFMERYARGVAARAYAEAADPPAGPVHLNLPFREPLVPAPILLPSAPIPSPPAPIPPPPALAPPPPAGARADGGRADGRPWTRRAPLRRLADPGQLDRLAARIAAEPRGLILAGAVEAGPDARAYADAVALLAARSGYPILAEPQGGLRFGPHDRSRVVAGYEAFLRLPDWCAARAPGLVLRLGASFTWRPVLAFLDRQTEAFQTVIDPAGAWDDPSRLAALHIPAEPAATCLALAERLEDRESQAERLGDRESQAAAEGEPGWSEAWREAGAAVAAARDALLAELAAEGRFAHSLWVYPTLLDALPEDALLVVANSMAVRDLDSFSDPMPKALRVLANRGAAGIDGTVSTALGAAHGAERPAVLITGDLAFLHDLNGLGLRGVVGPDLRILVLNDDGGGIFAHLPIAKQDPAVFERYFRTPTGADLAAACRTYGVPHRRAGDPEALRKALAEPGSGPRVVEIAIDADLNTAAHRRFWARVAERLSPAPTTLSPA